nr:mucin-22-like [Lytechinus pictus]
MEVFDVGEDTDSSRFDTEIVFGLFPNGQNSTDLGEFGSITQTTAAKPGTDITLSRPFSGAFLDVTVDAIPDEKIVTFTPATTVTRTTGFNEGTLRIISVDPIKTLVYGYNSANLTFGAMGTIPLEYLGQEYVVVVRANPGLGQVVISSLGQPTLVKISPNAVFEFNEILYDGTENLVIEIPAWGQMTVTTSSNDFTGSRILANQSVSVVSGAACAYTPDAIDGTCDYAIEQLLPYDRWGTVFNVPPFNGASASGYFVQVTAARDNTTVIVNGSQVDLNQRQTFDLDVADDTMLRITSNQPVQVMKFMKGTISMVLVPPEEQYTNQVTHVRMNPIQSHSFSHHFTIVTTCSSSSGLSVVYKNAGASETTVSLGSFSLLNHSGICAFSGTGQEGLTYKIAHSEPQSAFYVEVYGTSLSGSFAFVGNQLYKRLRCIDYRNDFLFGTTPSVTTQGSKTTTSMSQLNTSETTKGLLATTTESTSLDVTFTNSTFESTLSDPANNVTSTMGTVISETTKPAHSPTPIVNTTSATGTTVTAVASIDLSNSTTVSAAKATNGTTSVDSNSATSRIITTGTSNVTAYTNFTSSTASAAASLNTLDITSSSDPNANSYSPVTDSSNTAYPNSTSSAVVTHSSASSADSNASVSAIATNASITASSVYTGNTSEVATTNTSLAGHRAPATTDSALDDATNTPVSTTVAVASSADAFTTSATTASQATSSVGESISTNTHSSTIINQPLPRIIELQETTLRLSPGEVTTASDAMTEYIMASTVQPTTSPSSRATTFSSSSSITADLQSECVNVDSSFTSSPAEQTSDPTTACATSTIPREVSTFVNSSSITSTSKNLTSTLSAMKMCFYLAQLKLEMKRSVSSPLCVAATMRSSSSPSASSFITSLLQSSWVYGHSAEIEELKKMA